MTQYPKDNFYEGYSLGADINRSGKEHYQYIKQQLQNSGIKPTTKTINLSLNTIQLIHRNVKKYAKSEQEQRLDSLRKKKIVGAIIPIDITLADEVFRMLMDKLDPYVTASFLLFGFKDKILSLLEKLKTRDAFDKQTKNILKKTIINDKENLILKNVIEIHIHNDNMKKTKQSKTKIKNKSKKNKKKTRK